MYKVEDILRTWSKVRGFPSKELPNTKWERGKFSVNINGPRLAEFVNETVSHS